MAANIEASSQRRQYKGGQPPTKEASQDAWVVLLMIGTAYLPGALVAGYSLRRMKTRHQIVCMVTPDIDETTKHQLIQVYDEVVVVPYIEHATRPFKTLTQNEMYKGWIDRSFTKWNCLSLVKYRRVMLVDADIVFLVNVDELFDLKPPAACFSLPWMKPWQPQGLENPYVGAGGKPVVHGETVPADTVKKALLMKTSVGGGFLQLHIPSMTAYQGVLSLLDVSPVYGANHLTTSGADEQLIADYVTSDWTNIDPRYAAMPGKDKWVSTDIKAYHYFHTKPWELSVEEWPDLACWWRVADQLIKAAPDTAPVFRPTETTPLDAALADYRLMGEIRKMIMAELKSVTPKNRAAHTAEALVHMVDGALTPWLSENSISANLSWLLQRTWSSLFTADNSNGYLLKSGVSDLFKKLQISNPARLSDAIKEKVKARVENRPVKTNHRPDCGGGIIRYGGHVNFEMTGRDQAIADKSCMSAVHIKLFYATAPLLCTPLIPKKDAIKLAALFDITGEAFASSQQAHFFGEKDWVFSSPYDFEEPAGSCGNFFKLGPAELKRGWFIYLPAGPTAAAAAATRALEAIEQISFVVCPINSLTAASVLRSHANSLESRSLSEFILFAIHVPETKKSEVVRAMIDI